MTGTTLSAAQRRAFRVLRMVGELHQDGLQQLRIVPGMAASGMHWRCAVTSRQRISVDHGALLVDGQDVEPPYVAGYSSSMDNEYFGWRDATTATARQLADLFQVRFPELCAEARGQDWAYAGWYSYMLGVARQGALPVAYEDAHSPPPVAYMRTTLVPSPGQLRLLLPPTLRHPAHSSATSADGSSGAWRVPRLDLTVTLPATLSPHTVRACLVSAAAAAGVPEEVQEQLRAELHAAPAGRDMVLRVAQRWARLVQGH